MIRKIILVFVCVVVLGCSSGKQIAVEQPPLPSAIAEATPVRLEVAQAPRVSEVEDAIGRVFKGAAVLDANSKPNFLSGDFNGDTSQDLAVVLKPVPGKAEALNEEYAPWLLRDPRSNAGRQPLRIAEGETFLAVIHGYGVNDWRAPEATQTFVLKNVVGSDLRVFSGKDFAAANTGRKLPRPQGDLIGETLQGSPGYLYYATSTYSWYDPKTFKSQPQSPGVFHKSRTMRAHAEKPLPAQTKAPVSRDGFAAGCEARLRLAVTEVIEHGLGPGFGLRPKHFRAEPEPGAQPLFNRIATARHSLASHQGAEPNQTAAEPPPRGEPLRAHAQQSPMISAEELKVKLNNNEAVTIIDVRGSEGYAASRTTIKGAWHFKLRRLKSRFKFAPLKDLPKDREIVIYCACPKDESSISAAQIFKEAGFKRVKVLQGGWNEWIRINGPVQPK